MTASEKKTVTTADGSNIFYEITGAGSPLFLLHGNGGSGNYFRYQIPVLSRYFKVYTIDLRGHGKSTNTQANLDFELLADDIYLITEQEKIHCLNILGFSDGANLAMRFASNHPEMVKNLILNAGNTTVKGMTLPAKVTIFMEYYWFRFLGIFSTTWRRRSYITRLMTRDTGVQTEDLQKIEARTLVIVGKRDLIKHSHSIYLTKEIPQAVFVLVPGQGHTFAEKNPTLFNQEVLSFLSEKQVML